MPDIALLQQLLPGVPLLAKGETVSTNTDAKAWLLSGAAHGSLAIAGRQSAGRGRMARIWSITLSRSGFWYVGWPFTPTPLMWMSRNSGMKSVVLAMLPFSPTATFM